MHSSPPNDSPSEGSLVGSVFLAASVGAAGALLVGDIGGVIAGMFMGAAAGAALIRWTRPRRTLARHPAVQPVKSRPVISDTPAPPEPRQRPRSRSTRSARTLEELSPEAIAFSGCARALAYSRALIDSERGAPPRVAQTLAELAAGQLDYATHLADLANTWLGGDKEKPTALMLRKELAERSRASQQVAVRNGVDVVLSVEDGLPNRCRARHASLFLAFELLTTDFVEQHAGGELTIDVSRGATAANGSDYAINIDFIGVPCGVDNSAPLWVSGLCDRFDGTFERAEVEGEDARWRLTAPLQRPKRLTAPTAFVLADAKGTSVAIAVAPGSRRKALTKLIADWELEPLVVESPSELRRALDEHNPGAVIAGDTWLKHADVIAVLAERGRSDVTALRGDWASSGLRRFDESIDSLIGAELLTPLNATKLHEEVLNSVRARVSKSQRVFRPLDQRETLKVLVAEDNPVNARYVVRLLEKRGYEVVTATDGKLALELIAQEAPDLVLMDVNMPNLDGVSATQQWREIEQSQRVERPLPILALTAHAEKSERVRCLKAGMTGYITKPIVEAQLWDAMARASSSDSEEDLGQVSQPQESAFDEAKVLEFVAGDKEFLSSLSELFDQTAPQQVTAIRAALGDKNARDVERTAHQLKGSVSNFAAARARDLAQTIETAGRSGKVDGLDKLVDELELEVTRISAGLAALSARQR